MSSLPELYFETDVQWRKWLLKNYQNNDGVYLIFYKIENPEPSMRWEEAVRVALCFGWIDSTVKSLGGGKRRQYFCKRKPKSAWSALNKKHIGQLIDSGLMHESGLKSVEIAKQNGAWSDLDDVENGVIPEDLQSAFNLQPSALENYQAFPRSAQKSYLYWLHQAKRDATRAKRIAEIVRLCDANQKSR